MSELNVALPNTWTEELNVYMGVSTRTPINMKDVEMTYVRYLFKFLGCIEKMRFSQ